MLFRTNTGQLMEVKKYDFINDELYYKKIMEIKTPIITNNIDVVFSKLEKTFNNKKYK
jgi:hypothetical protein